MLTLNKELNVEKVKYEVSGMTCGGCQKSVASALARAGFIVSVADVSLAEGTVQVDAQATEAEVRRAIEDAGYQVGRRRAQ